MKKVLFIVSVGMLAIFFCVSLSGCGSIKTTPMAPGYYQVRGNGLSHSDNSDLIDEAKKVCPNGFEVVDKARCGDTCIEGVIKCANGTAAPAPVPAPAKTKKKKSKKQPPKEE